MSIPLDRLYHYIESVVNKNFDGDNIIYRFFPHGSKNINDLTSTRDVSFFQVLTALEIICHDQEPLNFEYYQTINRANKEVPTVTQTNSAIDAFKYTNLRFTSSNINDKALLLHSEKKSAHVQKYSQDQYIPVYCWSHAIIARDWFRYAEHLVQLKSTKNRFLAYNRAWAGSREYRLKFADLLIDYQLVDQCHTSVGFTDQGVYYRDHNFINPSWQPKHHLEHAFPGNFTTSCYSADFNVIDYESTDIEIVLETLFDDSRIHLTEKSLRPIALGQPFILAATAGSLEYLRSYGFKTFSSLIDESYDSIIDPANRLRAIVKLMANINDLPLKEYKELVQELDQIAVYNKHHFFSESFLSHILKELEINLQKGLEEFVSTNTHDRFINLREQLNSHTEFSKWRQLVIPQSNIKDLKSAYQLVLHRKKQNNK